MNNPEQHPASPIAVTVTSLGEAAIVAAIRGEVDLATASQLQTGLIRAIELHEPGHVVIDAAAMTFLDAAGMSALVTVYQYAEAKHVDIRIRNVLPSVLAPLLVVNLAKFLNVSA